MNVEYMSKVGHAMGCIWFTDEELSASLKELRPDLERAFGIADLSQAAFDEEQARVAIAHAMAFGAALQNISDTSNLERLMLTVGFLDESDQIEVSTIKCVALDKVLAEATAFQRRSLHPDASEQVGQLILLREQAAAIMAQRGFGEHYFTIPVHNSTALSGAGRTA